MLGGMCTVVVQASSDGNGLLVVANRDEQLSRPSRPPFPWPKTEFLAPRDEVAGGTWLGLNRHGVFVAITNRYLAMLDKDRRSRGTLVTEALALSSARAIHAHMAGVDAEHFNGFHLVYADREHVFATASDGHRLTQVELGAGRHVLTERSFDAGDDRARRARIERRWRARVDPATSDEARLRAMQEVLSEHDPADPFHGTCIHLGGIDYGTRSALVLQVPHDPARSAMRWAEGPPCTTPFTPVDLAPLFR